MAGQLVPLDDLPGRFASVSYDAERKMIVVQVDDAEGNVKGVMAWGYSEPVVTDEPAPEPEPVQPE